MHERFLKTFESARGEFERGARAMGVLPANGRAGMGSMSIVDGAIDGNARRDGEADGERKPRKGPVIIDLLDCGGESSDSG